MTLTLVILVCCLPLAGALASILGAQARGIGIATAAGGAGALAAAIALVAHILSHGTYQAAVGFVYVDPLSSFFVVTVAIVVALAGLGSISYLCAEEAHRGLSRVQVRLYGIFFGFFAALMLASLETGNLGLVWVLVEASTLASAVLVAIEGRATSLEAAWKYIIISSFGVTIALVGTLFLYYSASVLDIVPDQRLTWPILFANAASLQPASVKFALLLAIIGYGTKVGLAPMHTWLPDAHAEAPSPASAMLSAALLNTGMYAIIRFQALTGPQLGRYGSVVLLVFGFASIAIGALFMVRRRNFKRLFAYSSVEHMGIIAVGLGFGGVLGVYGALLHTLNHAIGKCTLFLASGEVVLRYRTTLVSEVGGILGRAPVIGTVMLLGSLAILGSPPFGLFLSEFTIVRAGFVRQASLGFLLLALLALAFIGCAHTVAAMVLGKPRNETPPAAASLRSVGAVPLVIGLAALLLLGLWIPGDLNTLILKSIEAIR